MLEPDNRLTHLKQHISNAADLLAKSSNGDDGLGSLIYLGNHHDSVPRELIADPHLESGEIHTWMLMKIQVSNPAIPTSIPSQEKLMTYLKCSRTILSRHLQVLRALRWITLCNEVRGNNGRYKGYVYAQHDKPLNLADTLFLDSKYIEFLESPHKSDSFKRLKLIKQAVLMHMDYQVVTDKAFSPPGALEVSSQHLEKQSIENNIDTHLACPDDTLRLDSNEAAKPDHRVKVYMDHVKKINMDKSSKKHHVNIINMDERPVQRDFHHVDNINTDENTSRVNFNMVQGSSTSLNSNINIKTTTTKQNQLETLRFPKILEDNKRLKLYAAKLLDPLSEHDQQFALDYLVDRIKAAKQGTCKPVDDLIGYLRWIITSIKNNTLPPSAFGIRESIIATGSTVSKVVEESTEIVNQRFQKHMKKLGVAIDPKTQQPISQ